MVRRQRLKLALTLSVSLTLLAAGNAVFAKRQAPAAQPAAAVPQLAPLDNSQAAQDSAPAQDTAARPDNAPSTVRQLEQRLFFKTYPNDELSSRLSRIEREVFGEPVKASTDDRLAKLNTVLQQKIDSEKAAQAAAETEAANAAKAAALASPAAPHAAEAVKESPEAAAARQRLAAQAAREAEINKLLAEGVDLYRGKHGIEAQQKFVQILRLDPANAQAHFNLGIVKESMGNYVEALANYQVAVTEDPGNKDYSDAVTAVKDQAAHQKITVDQQTELKKMAENANAAWKHGDYISALDEYLQLDTREPNKALIKYNIGSIYLMMKEQSNALVYYKQAHKLQPDNQKYTNAYEELSASVKKEEQQRDAIAKQAAMQYQQAQNPANGRMAMQNPARQQITHPPVGNANGFPPAQMNSGMPSQQSAPQPMQSNQAMNMPANGGMMTQQGRPMQMPQQQPVQMPTQMSMQMPQQQFVQMPMQMSSPYPMQQGGAMQMQMNPGMMQSGQMPMQMPGMMQNGQMPMQMNPGMMQNGQMPMQMNPGMMQNGQMPMQQSSYPGMPVGQEQFTQQSVMPVQQNVVASAPVQQQPPSYQNNIPTFSPFTQIIKPSAPRKQKTTTRATYGLSPAAANQLGFQNTAPGAIPIKGAATVSMSTFGISGRSGDPGVTVTRVNSGSRAAAGGLQKGDSICAIDGNQVSSPGEVDQWLGRVNTSGKVKFVIMRDGNLAVLDL
jgi:tetratricopeptide (TPR) repeat protein